MPTFQKLSRQEVQRIQSPAGRPELAEYVAFLAKMRPGDWARVVRGPRESLRAVKRRLGTAGRLLGKSLRYYGSGKKTEVIFTVARQGPGRPRKVRTQPRRTRRKAVAKAAQAPASAG
jgi:hypothetical protein